MRHDTPFLGGWITFGHPRGWRVIDRPCIAVPPPVPCTPITIFNFADLQQPQPPGTLTIDILTATNFLDYLPNGWTPLSVGPQRWAAKRFVYDHQTNPDLAQNTEREIEIRSASSRAGFGFTIVGVFTRPTSEANQNTDLFDQIVQTFRLDL